MFINLNHLNEGSAVKSHGDDQKKLLNEGENPKPESKNGKSSIWQKARTETHVNLNWSKFRK